MTTTAKTPMTRAARLSMREVGGARAGNCGNLGNCAVFLREQLTKRQGVWDRSHLLLKVLEDKNLQ
jgi:hypothetical protein